MDPFMLLERAFAAAADRLGSFRVRKEKALPASLDVFGWCTWDAFYSQVCDGLATHTVEAHAYLFWHMACWLRL